MAVKEDYKIQLEVFEGPLDLLLYLIKKNEVNIYDIPIETITTQYMEYLGLMRMLDLNVAGEFIVMAATLMMIKSRMLLPPEERPEMEEEEEDPRWELVRQLVEYKKFKDAASHLQEKEIEQENVFARGAEAPAFEPEPGVVMRDVSIFDLLAAFNEVLKRIREEKFGEILDDRYTVADKIAAILSAVQEMKSVSFFSLFADVTSRPEVICTFIALLELIRLKQIFVTQEHRFGEILIMQVQPENG